MRLATALSMLAALATLFVLFVPHWHRPVDGRQLGPAGSSMVQFENAEQQVDRMNRAPAPPPPGRWGVDDAALADTRPVTEAFPRLQAVTSGTAGEFMALQVAITQWVAPAQGCVFCHQEGDFGAETKPQFRAAREMLRMTRALNTDWSAHTAPSGVTCFTCHRGQNVPAFGWYPSFPNRDRPFIARQEAWHEAATTVRDFFPDAAYAEYLLQDTKGRAQSYTALPTTGPAAYQTVVRLYEIMMQMSDGIGVNCGYCHNSRAFADWGESTPARWSALEALRMTRAINREVLVPLAAAIPQLREPVAEARLPTIPAAEAGPQPGNALATCATCHYGSPKPLPGQDLLAAHRWLRP